MIKKLKQLTEEYGHLFEKDGKYSQLHTTYDAMYTFLFAPGHTARSGAHIRDGIDLKRTMITVVIAMIPALLFGMWNTGHQHFLAIGELTGYGEGFLDKMLFGAIEVLPIVIVSYGVGLGVEFLFATIRGHQVNEGYLVTGMLIPLVMPSTVPLWMVAVAVIFAVVIGKEVFGGTGMNILNVALMARAFVFFAYPAYMSGDTVWVSETPDGWSGATALAQAAYGGEVTYSFWEMFLGVVPGSIGETSTLMCLIGAALLIFTGIGSWRIMLSVVLGALFMGALFNVIGAQFPDTESLGIIFMREVPFYEHLVMGGLAFGLVYMATDPVTAAQTDQGKWWYGFFIGILTVLIRVVNPAYPEGTMLAILLMNVFAPLIDYIVVQQNIKRRLVRVTK
ncbi:MAG: NADH:ubiquinone reductase (Na(+)-transporting) subunit B [Bacteroidia bacterium]